MHQYTVKKNKCLRRFYRTLLEDGFCLDRKTLLVLDSTLGRRCYVAH